MPNTSVSTILHNIFRGVLLSTVSLSHALPKWLDEASLTAGFTRTIFQESKINEPFVNKVVFYTDTLSPLLELSLKKRFFDSKATLWLEGSYTFTSKNDYAAANSGTTPYRTKTYLWDFKGYILGPEVTPYNISLGLGFGYGRSCYISKYPFFLDPAPVDRSHGILPLLALKAGNANIDNHIFTLKYGTNFMSSFDSGYAPYLEITYRYLFKKLENLDHGMKFKFLHSSTPYAIGPFKSTPRQKSLYVGYELRFH